MTHIKSKLSTNEIPAFRKFLEARGFKCRDGKGDWQSLQVQNINDKGYKAFCHNAKGVVTSPVEFDALIQVFRAPVDPEQDLKLQIVKMKSTGKGVGIIPLEKDRSHDSDLMDDFAIAAMQGILSGSQYMKSFEDDVALQSYSIAKAMMAERAKHQPK